MQIVKLGAIDSTNAYLKRTLQVRQLEDFTVAVAEEQTSGRGQQGTSWVSEPGKNLIFSVFKKFNGFHASRHFYLNFIVSLSIYSTLKTLDIPNLHIKWPNDILSGNYKICGILIETILAGQMLKSAVIGVGLNLNQTRFPELPNATSLKLLAGKSFDRDEVLQMIIENLKSSFQFTGDSELEMLREEYAAKLFMKDCRAAFQILEGQEVEGFIRGVSEGGKLLVEFDNQAVREFDLKELKLLY
ncbi:biotin--[acetyl-CoA-carboxylase] ligase [Aggregatimonas sangjinii]|uniref:Biotin--[acetyl-CoA-carboxylase] ligase n=1 Tax=Aggregatimonas sangjinii TaxID=2583587 RepID=A0A5B7SQA9_9FLAO|nr:biotin--[acetyl-CoA-carboxylase] ligase [Aggregatimonas sangjinii]QCW99187.1 biotin--[acetyl-CoA-carboxylase] ligase [Aggregatimonas sangjinii]